MWVHPYTDMPLKVGWIYGKIGIMPEAKCWKNLLGLLPIPKFVTCFTLVLTRSQWSSRWFGVTIHFLVLDVSTHHTHSPLVYLSIRHSQKLWLKIWGNRPSQDLSQDPTSTFKLQSVQLRYGLYFGEMRSKSHPMRFPSHLYQP